MTIIKYKTGYVFRGSPIEKVECTRESESSVWVNRTTRGIKPVTTERRLAKRAEYEQYHDTWDDAKAYLVSRAQRKVDNLAAQLDDAKNDLAEIEGLAQKAGQ